MKTILIFEDDLQLAGHWQTMFESVGYRVIHEADIDAAIAVLEKDTVNLLLCDILIRGEDEQLKTRGGLSLLSYINLHIVPKPKVITVSGAAPILNVNRHAELFHPDLVMVKPVTDGKLLNAAAELLGRSTD